MRTSNENRKESRRLPVGVEVVDHNSGVPTVHARVWAPKCSSVELVTDDGKTFALSADGNGYFAGECSGVGVGDRYRFKVDGGDAYPDPASRFQPEGPHGSSQVVDASQYEWGDGAWKGIDVDRQIIYELHVGTFTKAGTFAAAIERLPDLVDIGVTTIEIMPLADFAGRFGWGYDGVSLFAPTRLYGTPDDVRAFVDAAHRLELAVILDVVYNHLGPDGNYLTKFSPHYFSPRPTEWGDSLNFDGEQSKPVREFFIANARYWIEEFHFDGLRLDATQQIFDSSSPHVVAEVAQAAREAGASRPIYVVAENETQRAELLRPMAQHGCGLDGAWNDDFHHAARVAATGRTEAYYSGYTGRAQEFVSAAKYGYLYQGSWYTWQRHRRGIPAFDIDARRFVVFIQNHDQVANSGAGRRLHLETSPGRYRALLTLCLLGPQTPMLFMGQEFCSSTPFYYFADHEAELANLVKMGRAQFVRQFPSLAAREEATRIVDPASVDTFLQSKLDWSQRKKNVEMLTLHRVLIKLRREDSALRDLSARRVDGAVISDHAFALRYFGENGDDRLLVVNLGVRLHADPLPEPLMVAPNVKPWRMLFSTERPEYGGWGAPSHEDEKCGWIIPAESAAFFAPSP